MYSYQDGTSISFTLEAEKANVDFFYDAVLLLSVNFSEFRFFMAE